MTGGMNLTNTGLEKIQASGLVSYAETQTLMGKVFAFLLSFIGKSRGIKKWYITSSIEDHFCNTNPSTSGPQVYSS